MAPAPARRLAPFPVVKEASQPPGSQWAQAWSANPSAVALPMGQEPGTREQGGKTDSPTPHHGAQQCPQSPDLGTSWWQGVWPPALPLIMYPSPISLWDDSKWDAEGREPTMLACIPGSNGACPGHAAHLWSEAGLRS